MKVPASKTGYGRHDSDEVAPATPIEIRLLRGAAISGRVVDALGDPVVGARIVAKIGPRVRTQFTGGSPSSGAGTLAASTDTDDHGEYRLGSLAPDTHQVAVITTGTIQQQVLANNQVVFSPSSRKAYYPDATTVETAEGLRVEPGDDRASVDFVVPAGQSGGQFMMMVGPAGAAPAPAPADQPTGIVRGRVVSTDGRGIPHALVRILPARPQAPPPPAPGAPPSPPGLFQPTTTTTDDDGRFELRELAAGSYRLAALKVGYSAPGDPVSFGPPPADAGPRDRDEQR